MDTEIANARFNALKSGNKKLDLEIIVKKPEPDPENDSGDFRCRVEMKGFSESTFIYGIDPLQALSLAMVYVRREVEKFLESGWELFHPEDDSEPIAFLMAYYADESHAPWNSGKYPPGRSLSYKFSRYSSVLSMANKASVFSR